ncbi:MAG: LysR family transcriptional regulator [Clostridiales bacterium]|nr:LysR family transcriptional regulator [Clostridiales bacterium]
MVITIFKRTSKGITVTPDGEEFLRYARRIISQVDEVEAIYSSGRRNKQTFSLAAPGCSYIALAFTEFAKQLPKNIPSEIFYRETNTMNAISDVVKGDCNLGVIRYLTVFDKYFRNLIEEKKLIPEIIADFSYELVMSEKHPLANKENILLDELRDYIEISNADSCVPSLPSVEVKKAGLSEIADKHINVFERATQFEILENVADTFMWVSPLPDETLKRYGLTVKKCSQNNKIYRDMLIYRKDYKLSELDKRFITELCNSKRKYIK